MINKKALPVRARRTLCFKLIIFRTFTALILFICTHQSYAQNSCLKRTSGKLMGMTISEAINYLQIDSSAYRVVQEPFGVLRGIRGQYNDIMFLLYVDRTGVPITIDTSQGEWLTGEQVPEIMLIWNKEIIGVSMKKGKETLSRGITIVYYDFKAED